jgi:hypothetical protein
MKLLKDTQDAQRAWTRQLDKVIEVANHQVFTESKLQEKHDQAHVDMVQQNIEMEKLQTECHNRGVEKQMRLDMVQQVARQELRIKQLEKQVEQQPTAPTPNMWEAGAPLHRSDGRSEVERDGLAWYATALQAWGFQKRHHITATRLLTSIHS